MRLNLSAGLRERLAQKAQLLAVECEVLAGPAEKSNAEDADVERIERYWRELSTVLLTCWDPKYDGGDSMSNHLPVLISEQPLRLYETTLPRDDVPCFDVVYDDGMILARGHVSEDGRYVVRLKVGRQGVGGLYELSPQAILPEWRIPGRLIEAEVPK